MKLSKVKKVCCQARQMDVVNTSGANNMITQWVGTDAAMYPLIDMRVQKEQLQRPWELTEKTITEMEQVPVAVWANELDEADAQIDIATVPRIALCNIDGYEVLVPEGSGLKYIPGNYLKPLDGKLDYMPLASGWVAVYEDGVLGAMVRPVAEKCQGALDTLIRRAAERVPGV